jgi:hypothetical protein
MSIRTQTLILSLLCLGLAGAARGQNSSADRLPFDVLDIRAPSERVSGSPGSMQIQDRSCRALPSSEVRSRIVNAAVQEWAYFGFTTLDYTDSEISSATRTSLGRRWSLLSPDQSLRVADSIAGYWAAAPDSGWILERQNNNWKSRGMTTRWRDPWSAAFISWVMCEGGLADRSQFARAVAHHTYIDQAIRARDNGDTGAAFQAYDIGEQAVMPGDMLCRGSRPAYRSLAERRSHFGVGARTHCDIVVKVDTELPGFHVIGGNVRGTVGLKLLPGELTNDGFVKAVPYGNRTLFAHLKLNAEPLPLNALDLSPTMQALDCRMPQADPIAIASLAPSAAIAGDTC